MSFRVFRAKCSDGLHTRPIRSSVSPPRSNTAAESSASSPTIRLSFDSLALCCSNRTTNGHFNVATCSWRDYNRSARTDRLVCRTQFIACRELASYTTTRNATLYWARGCEIAAGEEATMQSVLCRSESEDRCRRGCQGTAKDSSISPHHAFYLNVAMNWDKQFWMVRRKCSRTEGTCWGGR